MSSITRVAFSTAALAACAIAQTNGCIDQSYTSGSTNGLEVTSNQNVIQTFTVGGVGFLAQVDIDDFGLHRGTGQLPFDVSIVTTDPGGVPTLNALATVTFQAAQVGSGRGTLSVDLTSFGLFVQPGEVYGIKLDTRSPSGGPTYAWGGDAPGGYANGAIYIRDSIGPLSFDLGFRVWVDPGGSALAYGTGFGGASGPPTLNASTAPARGATFDLLCSNPQPVSATGAVLIGPRTNTPTPFGGTLLVNPIGTAVIPLAAAGTTSIPIAVSSDASACGLVVAVQLLTTDSSAAFGIGFSNGLELTVGY